MTQSYPSYTGPEEPLAGGPTGPAPQSTALAVRLMYLLAALSVVGLVVTLATRSSLESAIRTRSPNLSAGQVHTALDVGIAFAVVVGVVFLVLYTLLARQVGRGRNWARVVTVVLAALSVLSTLSALVQPGATASKALSVVSLLVNLALVYLLAVRADSRAYFAARR